MFQYLLLIPFVTSLILGAVYLRLGDARPAFKGVGAAIFALATYLQFASGYPLAGLLLQTCLALYLALWRRMNG